MNHYWLSKHLSQWRTALAADHRPHALIIQGDAGMGKQALMENILVDLLCREANPDACGKCQNCLLFAGGHHPDVHMLEPESDLIKVGAVRELNQFFTSTPHCSDHKVSVIKGAELMNVAAANALLKILEEPPPRGLLILITAARHRLMPTIRSRCVDLSVYLSQEEKGQLLPWLTNHFGNMVTVDEAMLKHTMLLSDHRPLAALEMLEAGGLAVLTQMMDLIYLACSGQQGVSRVSKTLSEYEERQSWLLFQVQCHLLLKSIHNQQFQAVLPEHPLNQLIKKSPKVIHIVVKITELIEQLMINLNTQIKTQLMLESLLVAIKQELNPGRL